MEIESFDWIIVLCAAITFITNVFLLVSIKKLRVNVTRHHSQMLTLTDYIESPQFKKEKLKGQPAVLERTVHQSTAAVETIHLSISDTAFGVIDTIAPNDKTKAQGRKLRELHNGAATGIYRSLKTANRHVGTLTDTIIPRKRKFNRDQKKK